SNELEVSLKDGKLVVKEIRSSRYNAPGSQTLLTATKKFTATEIRTIDYSQVADYLLVKLELNGVREEFNDRFEHKTAVPGEPYVETSSNPKSKHELMTMELRFRGGKYPEFHYKDSTSDFLLPLRKVY
ncbi:MAG: hypothetical protein AAGB31_11130, partial [Bdellovibrio sp.]